MLLSIGDAKRLYDQLNDEQRDTVTRLFAIYCSKGEHPSDATLKAIDRMAFDRRS